MRSANSTHRSYPGETEGTGPPVSRRGVVDGVDPAAGLEPALNERSGSVRLGVEESNADCEDAVEALLAEVEVFEVADDERRTADAHVGGIALRRSRDHPLRAVHADVAAVREALAQHRRGHAMPAADLEDVISGRDAERIDDRLQPGAQSSPSQ